MLVYRRNPSPPQGAAYGWRSPRWPAGDGGEGVRPPQSARDLVQASSTAKAKPRLNWPFVASLMLANFGANVALIAPIQNILPRMVESASGASGKALGLGMIVIVGLVMIGYLLLQRRASKWLER